MKRNSPAREDEPRFKRYKGFTCGTDCAPA